MPRIIYWNLAERSEIPLKGLEKFLSSSELRTLSTFRFPKRQNEWLLGRWTIKSLVHGLPDFPNLSLTEIEVLNARSGAPYLHLPFQNGSEINVSVSHRDHLSFCAATMDPTLSLGADIEKIEYRPKSFMEDYLSSKELDLVNTYPMDARDCLTTLIWSIKEAMLKALKVGLRMDTRQVEIRQIHSMLPPRELPIQWQEAEIGRLQETDNCWMAWWRIDGDYVLTIAGHSEKPFEDNPPRLIRMKNPDVQFESAQSNDLLNID